MDEITSGSTWKHQVTGNEFVVIATKSDPEYPEPSSGDESEEYVYVEALDYETRDNAWLAQRLFESQLEQVS